MRALILGQIFKSQFCLRADYIFTVIYRHLLCGVGTLWKFFITLFFQSSLTNHLQFLFINSLKSKMKMCINQLDWIKLLSLIHLVIFFIPFNGLICYQLLMITFISYFFWLDYLFKQLQIYLSLLLSSNVIFLASLYSYQYSRRYIFVCIIRTATLRQ